MKHQPSQKHEPRNAWTALCLVLLGFAVSVVYALVDYTPWNGDLLFPLLIILTMSAGVSFAIRTLGQWPVRFDEEDRVKSWHQHFDLQ